MRMERRVGEALGRVAWKLWPSETLKVDRVEVVDGRSIAVASGSRERWWGFVRVRLPEIAEDPRSDYASAVRATVQQQRVKGLFEGLHRAAVPFAYISMMRRGEASGEKETFEFDLAVGTWVDGKFEAAESSLQALEQQANVLSATLGVALPSASVERLLRQELLAFARSLFLPGGLSLHQNGDPASLATLHSFDEKSPQVGKPAATPGFYLPNALESGRGGILLGTVKSGSGSFHDFRLQPEDLKQHVAILGMTGSGKSTTGETIVAQAAALGLPVLVLDWHNEYGRGVAAGGGLVVSPGKEDFTMNPLEAGGSSDPVEHLAMVSDVFSDIYHFTHPQAFMFRNALQKRVMESGRDEVLTLTSLVKTIEGYPLRSAYDNETKVALLRRLVPLTQGQAGKALDGPSTISLGDLLDRFVCVELGHLRDVQTRSIFAEIVLKTIYEQRVKGSGVKDHMTVVEEARNVAPARRAEDPPSVGERMISELRKFGESMMFIAQFPSQVASEVVKNSGTRIIHRVSWPEDVAMIGDSMSLTQAQREHVTKLEVGEAVVSVSRIPKPVLIQVSADFARRGPSRDFSFSGES